MAQTQEYRDLGKRFTELRKNLLPPSFDPTGDYPSRWHDRTRGFLLLTHAEIEYYLENQCKKILIKHIREWKSYKSPSKVLLALSLSFQMAWGINKENEFNEFIKNIIKEKKIEKSVTEILDKANNQYMARIKRNNGIREENIKSLIIPLGIDIDDIDSNLLVELDDFGILRGENAHKSKRIVQLIDPKITYERVKKIKTLLKDIDRVFFELTQ